MENVLEVIRQRYSVRTYEPKPVEPDKLQKLENFLLTLNKGPFGSKVRYKLIDIGDKADSELKKFISYGNIKGARYFIDGTVEKGEMAMEDFGYCMEKAVLFATSLGLGTVWLGGSLNRGVFAEKMNATENEVIPAITPVGYAAEKRGLMDRMLRTMSGGKNRKPFSELFFNGDLSVPLDQAAAGKYFDVLEAVRWSPSASNKQPWRIIKDKSKNDFHLYISEAPGYNSAIKDIRMQYNDMGIAMAHFELSAQAQGLSGSWKVQKPPMDSGSLNYIVSWIG
ncbi:MAG: nitroreductase family protein [Clostridia bacterium]|nr:nitroreductase family protein [Clostridia bacterium]